MNATCFKMVKVGKININDCIGEGSHPSQIFVISIASSKIDKVHGAMIIVIFHFNMKKPFTQVYNYHVAVQPELR